MPAFDLDSCRRIGDVVRRVEGTYADNTSPDVIYRPMGEGEDQSYDWYQVLSDADDASTYAAWGNPGEFSDSIGFLTDAHGEDANPVNSDYTAILLDVTGQIPLWRGDWVVVQSLEYQFEGEAFEDYVVKAVVAKASAALEYWGWLDSDLDQGSSGSATLIINASPGNPSGLVSRTVWDGGLLSGTMQAGTPILAEYFPSLRSWYVTGAPCYTAASP